MDPSVSNGIHQVWRDVHSPDGLPFPKTVERLTQLGVERYHVDFIAQTVTAYTARNADVAAGTLERVEGPNAWNVEKIKEAVRQVQGGLITYSEFSKGIIDGGVTNYWACLTGKRVIYMGRLGDFHIEWFPGQRKD